MSYSLSGSKITQSGTDTDLSGLSAITGVTTTVLNGITHYDLGAIGIIFTGTQTIDARVERVYSDYVPTNGSKDAVYNLKGTLTINDFEIFNGETIYYNDVALNSAHASDFCCGQFVFYSDDNSSNFIMNGGAIIGNSTMELSRGDATFNDVELRIEGGGSLRWFIRNYAINGMTIKNVRTVFDNRLISFELNNISFINSLLITQGRAGDVFPLREPNFLGTPDAQGDIGTSDAGFMTFINHKRGSLIKVIAGQPSNTRCAALVRVYKELELKAKDVAGNPIENIVAHIKDYNNSQRRNWTATNSSNDTTDINFTNDRFYALETNSSGESPLTDILLSVVARPNGDAGDAVDVGANRPDVRNKGGVRGVDVFDISIVSYLYGITETSLNLTGEGKETLDWTVFTDRSITETTKSTVDAYTTVENPFKLYDFAKAYSVDNFPELMTQDERDILISREGNVVDFGDRDVTIDANATDVFAIGSSGNLTIKATVFTGNIKTTGSVTLSNGSTVDGFIADENGDSGITVTVPAGYNNSIGLYPSQTDAEDETNIIDTGPDFTYFASTYGGQTLWYRLEQADGSYIIENYLIPSLAGFYSVNLVVTGENAALASIKAVTDRLDSMIDVVGGNQVFNANALSTIKPDLTIINENIKKTSLIVPATQNLT